MPTVRRSDKGIEMKPGTSSVRVSRPESTEALDVAESAGPQFREQCEVVKAPTPEPVDKLIMGIEWTPLDKDGNGQARTYMCEGRAMKIAANHRRERGEPLSANTEWVLFRMGSVIFRSTNLDEVFEMASIS